MRICFKPTRSVIILLLLMNHMAFGNHWRELSPGLDYQDLNGSYLTPWSHIHAFRINLRQHQLALVMAKDLDIKYASAEEYAHHSNALITVNGGFFDKNYLPLGLRINEKEQKSPLKKISWWGVFYIKDNQPYVTNARQFNHDDQIEFAVQSGPRLLIQGKIPPLKPGRAERTALGVDDNKNVFILITDNAPLSTTELAQLMRAPPLNCRNALNLDGGSSSQLHAKINSFQLDVHGFSNVSDAVVVKKRT